MTRKVGVAGNSTFPISAEVGAEIVDVLLAFGDDAVFLTRGSPGFDTFIVGVAPLIGRRCFTYPSKGGADNFLRDIELVRDADEMLVFFAPGQLEDYDSGTAHILEKALDNHKPTKAYSIVNGSLIWVGES